MPKIPTIPYDKAVHFIYGAAIAVAAMYVLMVFGVDRSFAKGSGCVAALLIGGAKEIVDSAMNRRAEKAGKPPVHTVSRWDAVATALGGLLVLIA